MIEIKVNGSVVSVQETEPLYSGSAEVYRCGFTFDKSWDDFSKSAVFRVGGRSITAVVDEDGCTLPWELLTRANIGLNIEVGVYGVSAKAEVLTSVWDSIGTVRDGTELGNDAREPSAGVYEQIMASMKRVDDKVKDYAGQVQTKVQRAESAAAIAQENAERAAGSAEAARNASTAIKSDLESVKNALDNLPEGDTLIINDLTTGGAGAALSAEMGKVLGRRPNRNLLDNACFKNPVNQRGQTVYTGQGYTIDRWRNGHNPAQFELIADGLVYSTSNEGVNIIALRQDIENCERYAGREVTLSVLISAVSGITDGGNVVFVLRSNDEKATQLSINIVEPGLYSVTGTLPAELTKFTAFFYRTGKSASATIAAVKLELGSVQTLAYQDNDGNWVLNDGTDYEEELRRCQRYFRVINSRAAANAHLLDVRGLNATTAVGTLVLPEAMRAAPAVTVSGAAPQVWFSKTEGDMTYTALRDVASIAVSSDTGDMDRLRITVTVNDSEYGFEEGVWYDILAGMTGEIGQTTRLFLDANL